jgi:hypothetical protein
MGPNDKKPMQKQKTKKLLQFGDIMGDRPGNLWSKKNIVDIIREKEFSDQYKRRVRFLWEKE